MFLFKGIELTRLISAISFLFLLSLNTFALHSPPDLKMTDSRGEVSLVFVDFSEAHSIIEYDVEKKTVTAHTTIRFHQPVEGKAIFDLLADPTAVAINGKKVEAPLKRIDETGSRVRYIDEVTGVGNHTLTISNKIERLVSFDSMNKSVRSAFWMSDLSDRRFLESYLPSNLEYDQYQNNFTVKIKGTSKEHIVRVNGEVTNLEKNSWDIKFPAYYTSSSIYFHLMEKGAYKEITDTYKSIDGREIPIIVYSGWEPLPFMQNSLKILKELETDYGPWPHPRLIVYGAGSGGMEYAGATRTSMRALGHELHHCYFARSMMPSRGNNGWIDEALASWRDNGYDERSIGALDPSKMGAHSVYRRTTDRDAYSKGARVMAYFNYRLKENGGLRPFLKHFYAKYGKQSFVTQNFKDELEAFTKINFDYIFNPFVFGRGWKNEIKEETKENPMHPKLTYEEEFNLL